MYLTDKWQYNQSKKQQKQQVNTNFHFPLPTNNDISIIMVDALKINNLLTCMSRILKANNKA